MSAPAVEWRPVPPAAELARIDDPVLVSWFSWGQDGKKYPFATIAVCGRSAANMSNVYAIADAPKPAPLPPE